MKTLALVPVFNEAPNILYVLADLEKFVDEVLIVNDGSWDESEERVLEWMSQGEHNVELVTLKRNLGMSGAMLTGFALLQKRIEEKTLMENDIIVKIDADRQLKPSDIPSLKKVLIQENLALVRARRKFSKYPKYKLLGNKFMSAVISIFAGQKFWDVESGFIVMRASTLRPLLQYSTGYRYSLADELSVILPRLGYNISDKPLVDVPYFRSNTRVRDVLVNLAFGFLALVRVTLKIKSKPNRGLEIGKRLKQTKRRSA